MEILSGVGVMAIAVFLGVAFKAWAKGISPELYKDIEEELEKKEEEDERDFFD